MLSSKQIKFLKKEAHHLTPIFQIGKNGMNEELYKQVFDALEKRELIKVSLLQNTFEEPETAAADFLNSIEGLVLVQIIGHTLVLYKEASKEKFRKISPKVKAVK